jgi:hypothetical protein
VLGPDKIKVHITQRTLSWCHDSTPMSYINSKSYNALLLPLIYNIRSSLIRLIKLRINLKHL